MSAWNKNHDEKYGEIAFASDCKGNNEICSVKILFIQNLIDFYFLLTTPSSIFNKSMFVSSCTIQCLLFILVILFGLHFGECFLRSHEII